MQALWLEKMTKIKPEIESSPDAAYVQRAGIYAEFGKIICISVGYFTEIMTPSAEGNTEKRLRLRLKSFAGDDETHILEDFFQVVGKMQKKTGFKLVGHNIQEFDVPYLCRRAVILQVELPEILELYGRKPWEVPVLDTMQLWRFGDHKHFTTLQLLTEVLGIPSSKDDITGQDVARVYWEEQDLERISRYCQKDVVAVAQLLLRLKRLPLLTNEDIEYV
ncbi:MAG: ribonuclease H-like domain-containing protein [Thermoflavifilum sp.]|nr:ribonuclease H-like domain-containing protein [Thermoflavifilum sp.]